MLIALSSTGFVAPAANAVAAAGNDAYTVTVNGQTSSLSEGQTVTFPMQAVKPTGAPGTISANAVYLGNGGTITVTASHGVYYWSVATPCVGNFRRNFAITDLTSGLSGGFNPAFGFSGSAPTSKLYGHRYSGTLSGSVTNAWGTCAYTGPNNTLYKYIG